MYRNYSWHGQCPNQKVIMPWHGIVIPYQWLANVGLKQIIKVVVSRFLSKIILWKIRPDEVISAHVRRPMCSDHVRCFWDFRHSQSHQLQCSSNRNNNAFYASLYFVGICIYPDKLFKLSPTIKSFNYTQISITTCYKNKLIKAWLDDPFQLECFNLRISGRNCSVQYNWRKTSQCVLWDSCVASGPLKQSILNVIATPQLYCSVHYVFSSRLIVSVASIVPCVVFITFLSAL